MFYFYLTNVEVRRTAAGLSAVLPPFAAFVPNAARAGICSAPLFSSDVLQNPFFASFVLTTLLNPLLLPTPEPEAGLWPRSKTLYVTQWGLGEFQRYLYTLPVVALCAIIVLIPGCSDVQKHLFDAFTFYPREENSVEIEPWVYLTALFVLLLRSSVLLGTESPVGNARAVGRSLACVAIGWGAILYAYYLTGRIHIPTDNWEVPVAGGFVGASAWKLWVSIISTRLRAGTS